MTDFLGTPTWIWLTFIGIVVALLAFDLGVLHKDDHEIGVQESLLLSGGYIGAALLFGSWVWWYLGAQSGMDYFTGFMIEKSLSMDNVFVIALIFSFCLPGVHGHQDVGHRRPHAGHREQPAAQVPQAPHAPDGRLAWKRLLGA